MKIFTNMYQYFYNQNIYKKLSHSNYNNASSKLIILRMALSKPNLIPNFNALFLAQELYNTGMIKYARR